MAKPNLSSKKSQELLREKNKLLKEIAESLSQIIEGKVKPFRER